MANKALDEFLEPGDAVDPHPPGVDVVAGAPLPEPAPEPEPAPVPEPEPKAPEAQEPQPDPEPEDVAGLRKALLAERGKRNDYKGERDRLQGEMAALKAQMEELAKRPVAPPPAPPAPVQPVERPQFRAAPNPVEDPAGYATWLDEKQANDRANVSEVVLRAEIGDDTDVNSRIAVFQQAAAANPRLVLALRVHPDPYRYAYEQGKRIEEQRAETARKEAMLKEVGDDLPAWIAKTREQIIAEERAKWEAEAANRPMSAAPQPVQLPQSLGTARSAAPRQAPTVEEIPFEQMFGKRKRQA